MKSTNRWNREACGEIETASTKRVEEGERDDVFILRTYATARESPWAEARNPRVTRRIVSRCADRERAQFNCALSASRPLSPAVNSPSRDAGESFGEERRKRGLHPGFAVAEDRLEPARPMN